MRRSAWATRQLDRLLTLEGDALDLLAVHDAAVELGLESPLDYMRAERARAIAEHIEPVENDRLPVQRGPLSTAGYVYVIRSASGKHKIGSAANVSRRLASLQTGAPEPLTVILQKPTTNRIALEGICHKRFASKRLSGEWFDLNDGDIRWLADLPII